MVMELAARIDRLPQNKASLSFVLRVEVPLQRAVTFGYIHLISEFWVMLVKEVTQRT
jgi:hypothetical protein